MSRGKQFLELKYAVLEIKLPGTLGSRQRPWKPFSTHCTTLLMEEIRTILERRNEAVVFVGNDFRRRTSEILHLD